MPPNLAYHFEGVLENAHGLGARAVVWQRRACWAGAAGYRTLARAEKPRPDDRYPLFSITKLFLAVLALKLVEQGKLDLDAPLADPYPKVPYAGTVTLRMLLNHTSGLPDYGPAAAYHTAVRAQPDQPWTTEQILACALAAPWDFPPGTGWNYSNTGYWLAGAVLEAAAGKPLGTLLQTQLFEPLGLTTLVYPAGPPPALAPGHSTYLQPDPEDDAAEEEDLSGRYHPGWAGPAGALVGTPEDVAAFVHRLFQGEVLAAEHLAELRTTHPVPGPHPDWFDPHYGLGIGNERGTSLGDLWGHSGFGPGYTTMVQHAPAHDATAVVFSNTDRIAPNGLLFPLLRHVLGVPRRPAP